MASKGLLRKEISAGKFKFAIGLVIMVIIAATLPVLQSYTVKLMQSAPVPEFARQQAELLKDYRYWVWSQWFGKNLIQMGSILAVIFGAGMISSEVSARTVYFLLAQPIRRQNAFAVKYAVNLAYLMLTALLSTAALYIAVVAGGKQYPVAGLAQQLIMGAAGLAVVFSIAAFCSTLYDRTMKSAMFSALAALLLSAPGYFPSLARFSVYYQMAGAQIYEGKGFPFVGFAVLAAVSIILYVLGRDRIAKRDF